MYQRSAMRDVKEYCLETRREAARLARLDGDIRTAEFHETRLAQLGAYETRADFPQHHPAPVAPKFDEMTDEQIEIAALLMEVK